MKAAVEALGIGTLLGELGQNVQMRVHIDSTAAKSICEREGLDKVRHVEVAVLWIQEQEARRQLPLYKVLGTENPADLMTKNLSRMDLEKYLNMINANFLDGRAATAPKVYSLSNNFEQNKKGLLDE